MRRRTDTPLTILVIGIFTVVVFGGGVVYFTGNTPILKLKAELEQKHPGRAFVTRLLPGLQPRIEVDVPAELVPDDRALAAFGVEALTRYRAIADRTRVEECTARVKGDPTRAVSVTLQLAWALDLAGASTGEIAQVVQRHGVAGAEVTVLGPAVSGAHVSVRGRAGRPDAATVADRAVAAVASLGYVGRVDLVLEGPRGSVTRAAGRDGR